MMVNRRHKKLLSQLALAAAVSFSVSAVEAGDTIKIGGMAPLSSPGSYQQGPELVLGLEWAVEDVNAAGGVLGKQVELIVDPGPSADRRDCGREAHHQGQGGRCGG